MQTLTRNARARGNPAANRLVDTTIIKQPTEFNWGGRPTKGKGRVVSSRPSAAEGGDKKVNPKLSQISKSVKKRGEKERRLETMKYRDPEGP